MEIERRKLRAISKGIEVKVIELAVKIKRMEIPIAQMAFKWQRVEAIGWETWTTNKKQTRVNHQALIQF